ncbi:glucokinase [Stackebrandtia endophytica]|uniref:Glucokinase n=1 Tax=Stackebrandtia endophytica TaxID=1496996 RepID=A0A543B3E4_9ACTN|nr:ROK family protein [Stackebrandtia endophytica]TQL79346.1 glucokinase [Stackebrandtia endophytica]
MTAGLETMDDPMIGVDIGGTKIAAATVDGRGGIVQAVVRPTPSADGPDAVLAAVADAIRTLTGHERAPGIGVGTGGVIDHDRGIVVAANDLLPGWAGTDVRRQLAERFGKPVAVDNDVNAFGLAEQRFGAGVGHRDVLYVSVGTGVGGALVLGGELHRGVHHTAGELGHLAVPEAVGRLCNCGRPDHLEAVASGPAISRRYTELGGERLDLRAVADRAQTGEPLAIAVITDGARALGRALAGLVNTIDVSRVVVGGGVADMGQRYWRPLTEAFADELQPGPGAIRPVPAALGSRSAVIGAASLLNTHAPPSSVDEGYS